MPKAPILSKSQEKKSTRMQSEQKKCQYCGKSVAACGISKHENSCLLKTEDKQAFEALVQNMGAFHTLNFYLPTDRSILTVYHGTLIINSEENILLDSFVQGSSHDRVDTILVFFFSITTI
jgi:uncharacterized protein (DUF1786 family)